jgi:hypothetical protein
MQPLDSNTFVRGSAAADPMKQPESTSESTWRVTVRVYILAILLATLIAVLHAAILFGLADMLQFLRDCIGDSLGPRPLNILLVVATISGLFAAHLIETGFWAVFFWRSGQMASFGDGWYFAGVSHTTLGYGDVVLRRPWRSLGPISAINGLITFGCSTAFLFLVLQEIWTQAKHAL